MRKSLILMLSLIAGGLTAPAAHAQDRQTLGFGRLLTNDYLGDGEDRWRTSSYTFNWLRGPAGTIALPDRPGVLLEHRFRVEIIAPRNLNGPGSDDRAYVGALTYGVHTQYEVTGTEVSLGLDVTAVGPQTGVDGAQDWFHDLIRQPRLGPDVIANQAKNGLWLSPVVEMARPFALGNLVEVRPFVEAQAGVEEIVRVGADVLIGQAGAGALVSRDSTTGHLIRTLKGSGSGWSFVAGADYGLVGSSAYFPDEFAATAASMRTRARLGAHWQADERITFFYGATWLSPEVDGQSEGQVLGSVKLNFNF